MLQRYVQFLISGCLLIVVATTSQFSQFHLSLVGSGTSSRVIDWKTPSNIKDSTLFFSLVKGGPLNGFVKGIFSGYVWIGNGNRIKCWHAKLEGLAIGDTIFYSLQQNDTNPEWFHMFDPYQMKFAILGDMAPLSQGRAAGISIPSLYNAVKNSVCHAVLHLGDISYELKEQNAENFMMDISKFSNRVPYMTTVGNHEYENALKLTLQNYETRFAGIGYGAGTASGSNSSRYYSFSIGFMYFVIIDTEIYGNEDYIIQNAEGMWVKDDVARERAARQQRAWVENNLKSVNRSKTPYVIMGGHRPPFQTPFTLFNNNLFFRDIVPLMDRYAIDLYVAGHTHAYYNIAPIKIRNYLLPPTVVVGNGGNNEFVRPPSQVNTTGLRIVANHLLYGYGYLTATRNSLVWHWGTTGSNGGQDPAPINWTLIDKLEIPFKGYLSSQMKERNIGGVGKNIITIAAAKTGIDNIETIDSNKGKKRIVKQY